jgi:hypothetical protein
MLLIRHKIRQFFRSPNPDVSGQNPKSRNQPSKQHALLPIAHRVLQFEQFALHVEAVEIALQVAVLGDDPVAGHDDGNGVRAVGQPDCPHGIGVVQSLRNGRVACGMAVGNFQELLPHALVELGATAEIKREVELGALPVEVLAELAGSLHDVFRAVVPVFRRNCVMLEQLDTGDGVFICLDFEAAKGGMVVVGVHHYCWKN